MRKVTSINEKNIKGYYVGYSYFGYVEWAGDYMRFVSEEEYLEYLESYLEDTES